ncbi:uncharacterized protein LOC107269654 [Cephus cinctus]|uniref:Uncharacterized protein LOC107269654 n=1 Tax=Cephus cinctus TaxID=211228 RepID=A0AAJ7C1N1_CEPCN|nr:uncharacterized protein LOC107269654 [Cephus cinctus]
MVTDFRKLNEKTVSDAYPLPNILDILDQLGQAQYFSTFDLASGFQQISMDRGDRGKTAFSTLNGHYEYAKMPEGLKNAPATFQRLMDNVLREHKIKVRRLMRRLEEANLTLQPDKCEFLLGEVAYLGHIVGRDGLRMDPKKLRAVKKFPTPKTQKNNASEYATCTSPTVEAPTNSSKLPPKITEPEPSAGPSGLLTAKTPDTVVVNPSSVDDGSEDSVFDEQAQSGKSLIEPKEHTEGNSQTTAPELEATNAPSMDDTGELAAQLQESFSKFHESLRVLEEKFQDKGTIPVQDDENVEVVLGTVSEGDSIPEEMQEKFEELDPYDDELEDIVLDRRIERLTNTVLQLPENELLRRVSLSKDVLVPPVIEESTQEVDQCSQVIPEK